MAQIPLPAPQSEIRRFDVFAEWNRLKARHSHRLPETDAQAYGLAVAKVVAGFEAVPFGEDIKAADLGLRGREGDLCHKRLLSLLLVHAGQGRR